MSCGGCHLGLPIDEKYALFIEGIIKYILTMKNLNSHIVSEKTFDISVKPKSRIMLKLLATFLPSWFLFAPALS